MERFEAVTSTSCSAYICMDRNISDVYALAPCCGLTISENQVDHKVLDSPKTITIRTSGSWDRIQRGT